MSHTTPATAIADLQGQLVDVSAEVANALSYLTDCRTAVAASSFATVMAAGTPESTAPVESDEYTRTRLAVDACDNGLMEALQHCPEFFTEPAVHEQVVDRLTNFTHDACLRLRRELTHDVLKSIDGFEQYTKQTKRSLRKCEEAIQNAADLTVDMKDSPKANDAHTLKLQEVKMRFDEDLTFIKRKMEELESFTSLTNSPRISSDGCVPIHMSTL